MFDVHVFVSLDLLMQLMIIILIFIWKNWKRFELELRGEEKNNNNNEVVILCICAKVFCVEKLVFENIRTSSLSLFLLFFCSRFELKFSGFIFIVCGSVCVCV